MAMRGWSRRSRRGSLVEPDGHAACSASYEIAEQAGTDWLAERDLISVM
jgi:hypothetical protein